MAGEDLSVDCHSRTLEDLRTVVEETIDILSVYEGNLKWNSVKECCKLFYSKVTARKDYLSVVRGFVWFCSILSFIPGLSAYT